MRRRTPDMWKSQRGATLPLVLLVILFLTLLGYMALMTSSVEVRLAAGERDYQQALYVAESGIDHFIVLLRNDPDWKSRLNASPGFSTTGGITADLNEIRYHAYAYDDGDPADDDVYVRCDATTDRGTRTSVENLVRITVVKGGKEVAPDPDDNVGDDAGAPDAAGLGLGTSFAY